jgi:diguanylate cyclase (GGDEF)-like protein
MYKYSHLSHYIKTACVMTLLTICMGAGFALYKNWQLRLENTQVQLMRASEIVNMLLEHTLADSEKTMRAAAQKLEDQLPQTDMSPAQAQVLLNKALQSRTLTTNPNLNGLFLRVNAQGQMITHNGALTDRLIDCTDRFYFQDLRSHPEKTHTIGPLVISRLTGQWVFHLAVPIHDKQGKFSGVLVEQFLEKSIVKELTKYINPSDLSKISTHYNGNPVSFTYPTPQIQTDAMTAQQNERVNHLYKLDSNRGTSTWHSDTESESAAILVGFARSPVFNLMTYATIPMVMLAEFFLYDNIDILIYFVIAITIIVAIFYQVNKLANNLLSEQIKALHDPLTKLHNRRALDEILPLLQRESMRSQQPLSVLFIDIDCFRRFNEKYGHETGDLALVSVATSLAACCRRPMDFICRWGGEEFVAVLPHTNSMAAEKVAMDMLTSVRSIELNLPDAQDARITVSVGSVTSLFNRFNQTDDLIDMADKAMQKAKSDGRNQLAVFQLTHPIHALTTHSKAS